MSDRHILVLYAHPAPHRSPVNRRLAETAQATPGVVLHDLYDTYPDFDIDAERERALAREASVLVFLHPIRWYGMPSLLKEWLDVVLVPGWAYGKRDGERTGELQGKGYWLVATTGSGEDAYQPGGLHGRPFADFLAPFEQTAALCGMDWIAPLVMHGAAQAGEAAIDAHVAEFARRLHAYAAPLLAGTGKE
jgi:glutathione-regulated potassium-efflux system ancillary protein KefF